ncbi:MAG TPA: hypothetical protein VGR37_21345 [Longimicrobiaceae bacterium]|nr:hypothetical protein [Longimicrobiaceae bacterium]
MRLLRLCPALAAALLGLAAPLAGQAPRPAATGSLLVSATILEPPLTGVGVKPLTFGSIPPGTASVTVLPRTPAGGEWRLSGVRNRKSISISFNLPAALTGPDGATLPLSFNGDYAGLCEIDNSGNCEIASFIAWNPVATPTFNDTPERYKPGRRVYLYDQYSVYIGGQALPQAAGQRPGRYTGTVGVVLVVN